MLLQKKVSHHRLVDVHNYCVMHDLELVVDDGDAWVNLVEVRRE